MPALGVPTLGTTALGGETGVLRDPPVVSGVAATTTATLQLTQLFLGPTLSHKDDLNLTIVFKQRTLQVIQHTMTLVGF